LAALALVACRPLAPQPTPSPAPLRAGLVTSPGAASEGTRNGQAIEGARRAIESGGGEFTVLESSSAAAIGQNITALIAQGYRHIVTVGPTAADPTASISDRNRAITFSIVDFSFDPALPNAQGLIFREDQAAFLAGALAGLMSDSQVIGVVAGRDVPRVRKYRNGFEQGVRATCPACRVLGTYVGSAGEAEAAVVETERQIAAGADVIFGVDGAWGEAAILYAAQEGIYVIGAETDAYLTTFAAGSVPGADRMLTSAIKRVDVAVQASLEARQRGTFAAGTVVFDASNGGIGLASFHKGEAVMTPDMARRLAEIEAGLADGSIETGVDFDTGMVNE
jgi:basic membrane lipoprotein Med (substrate-binding protein (PBP1-ABC) superfamily)